MYHSTLPRLQAQGQEEGFEAKARNFDLKAKVKVKHHCRHCVVHNIHSFIITPHKVTEIEARIDT